MTVVAITMREVRPFAGWLLLALVALPFVFRFGTPLLGRRVKAALLFCSGVKRNLLAQVPTEESNYVGLGSAVLITSCVATFSMLVAITLVFHRPWTELLPFALAYGLVIFALDRFLVSGQLNPHQFSTSLTLGDGDARGAGVRTLLRTLFGAVPRLAFAVVIGFLIAEPMLLVLFRPEITTQLDGVRRQLAKDAEIRVDNQYEERLDALRTPRPGADEIDKSDRALAAKQEEIDVATTQRNKDLALARAECNGMIGTLAGVRTTGRIGCGRMATEHAADAELQRANIKQLNGQLADLRVKRKRIDAGVGKDEARREADLKALENERERDKRAAITKAKQTDGLLIQIDALERLATVDDPYPSASTTRGDADGSADVHAAGGGLFGLTTLGKTIWTVRLWLVLLDALPVFFKVMLSLRRRRPYDALVAQEEEAALDQATVEMAVNREERDARLEKLVVERAKRRDRIRQLTEEPAGVGIRPQVRMTTVAGTRILRGDDATIGDTGADVAMPDGSGAVRVRWDDTRGTHVVERVRSIPGQRTSSPIDLDQPRDRDGEAAGREERSA